MTFLSLSKTNGQFKILPFNSASRKLSFWHMLKWLPSSWTQCVGSCMVLAEGVLMSTTEIPKWVSLVAFLQSSCLICFLFAFRKLWKCTGKCENKCELTKIIQPLDITWCLSHTHWVNSMIIFYNWKITHIPFFVHIVDIASGFCFVLVFYPRTK